MNLIWHKFYAALANNKNRFDVKTGKQDGTLPARFPIIEDMGAILFQLGFHGNLETEPKNELVVYGEDMLHVSKMQKYKHLTEFMLDTMRSKHRNCGNCSKLNNQNFVKCPYGTGEQHKFSHKGEDFELCQYNGFEFILNNETERNVLRKWIELELAWGN